ncbi:MAG: sigma-54-dependent transcriptional regulator [Oligoflexus sp.]
MTQENDSEKPRALIVDDEERIRLTLADVFEDEGWGSEQASNGQEAVLHFKESRPDLVLLDVWMPGVDGISTLQSLKKLDPDVPVVIMSGHGAIETAVRATKLGAFDYLEKPLSLDKILPLMQHALDMKHRKANRQKSDTLSPLIGGCDRMLLIKRQIDIVAPRNSWVLITGENGTGKEVVARHIHEGSSRAGKTFVAVNCAAIPEELIESELFGHTKGAFTNAINNKKGRFELAHEGTMFLDEIGDMSLKTQAKILRILQERSFERLGGTESIQVDVRVIAATNKNLKEEIKQGRFREDLYYRLNVIPFELPALRERGDDLRELVEYFLEQMSADLGEEKKRLHEDAYQILRNYEWPGNIRELKNLLERLCIMIPEADITARQLQGLLSSIDEADHHGPEAVVDPLLESAMAAATLKQAKTDFERAFILDKLEENQWSVTKTAESIGVERSNLHRKLKLYGIDPKQRG